TQNVRSNVNNSAITNNNNIQNTQRMENRANSMQQAMAQQAAAQQAAVNMRQATHENTAPNGQQPMRARQENVNAYQGNATNNNTHQTQNPRPTQQPVRSAPARQQSQPTSHSVNNAQMHQQVSNNGLHQQREQSRGTFADYEQSLNEAHVSNIQEPPKGNNSSYETKQKKSIKKQKNKKANNLKMSKSTKKGVRGFMFGGLVLVFVVLAVIILPKTSIIVQPRHTNVDETIEMTARTEQEAYDSERRLMPARLIDKEVTFTKTFNATGSDDVKAQKAQGKITIFNEYNDKPQPLVATTRFLAEDGTLFRLVNTTTVPGMSDGNPGKVEALVIADTEGEGGNIGPSKFSVPGFEASPKKGKFYATSDNPMTGGGAGGSNVTIVTADDIEKADKEMNTELSQYIMEQVTALLRPDNEVLTDDSIEYEIVQSEANVSKGTMTDQFMYEIVSHVRALVFSENDVLAVMEDGMSDDLGQYDDGQAEVALDYKEVDTDFENETIKLKAQGVTDVVSTVDVEAFKNDILGKTHDEILVIMEEEYGDEIERVTIDVVMPGFPSFIANRVSKFGFMTSIVVSE
ncbi:MAG: hypothetical protein ABFQ53_01510, partial [Patescibacteria group bacterium]